MLNDTLLTGFASGSASERMQVGDVNLDGHLDAIIGQNADYAGYPSGVMLLLGNGDGSFAAPTMVVSGRTAAPALIDTDGDGRLDIVSATTAAPFTLSVRLGNGDGSFRPPMDQSLPTATAGPPLEIDAVDLDGSGRLDLVLPIGGSSATSALEVLYSIGTGSFASFVPPVTIGAGPMQGIAFADFDRDGRADFAAVTDGLSVALGHGNGTFTPVPAAPLPGTASDGDAHPLLAGDVNGDGLPDLVVSTEFFGGQVAVSLGEGDGTFQPGQTFDALSPSEPLLVDVDNDGRPDIVTLDRLSPPAVSVHIGNGDGTFQDAHGLVAIESSTIALFDFDGNGTLDIVGDSVAAGHGDGTFDAPASPSAGFILPNADSVRDWNGDGKLDFVGLPTGTAQPNGDVEFPSVILELGNGDGTFQARASMVRNFNRIVGVGSFDSDCQPDLVIYGPFGVEVLHGRADGTFLEGIANLAPAQRDQASVIGDFDGDGRLDLVVAGQGGVSLLRGDGGGAFAVGVDLLAQPVFGAAAGDVDEDGHLDLALTRTDPAGYVVVLRGRGDGTFAPPAPLLPGKHVQGVTGDHVIALADVDSDGHADLVVATEIDGVLLLPGNGDGSFQAARTWSVAPDTGWYPDAIALGDINGDGRTDAVVTFSSIGISHHIVALPLSTCGM